VHYDPARFVERGAVRKRSFSAGLVATLAVTACGGGASEQEADTILAPAEGVACSDQGAQTGFTNGTLECRREGDQLVWRVWQSPGDEQGEQVEQGEQSGNAEGVEGTPCPEVGSTTGLPDGTAECVDEGGQLVWRRLGGPIPELPDGVVCGSSTNPPNPLALPTDNDNVRASLTAFPKECVYPYTTCEPEGDQGQYQWYRTDYNLAIDPRNPSRLLVGLERLGLFESLDGGDTWQPLSEDGILHSMTKADGTVCWGQTFDITFDPAVSGRIYLNHGGGGTVNAGIWQSRGHGLYRSDDDGRTWNLLTTPDMNAYVAGFTIDPTSSDTLYMGTSSAPQTDDSAPTSYVNTGLLYRSDDAGRTWRELPTGWGASTVGSVIVVDPTNRDALLLGVFQYSSATEGGAPTGTGLGPGWYRSTDGGASWQPHGEGDGARVPVSNRVAVSPDGAVMLSSNDQLWGSTDGGQTWYLIDPTRWLPTIDPHGDGRRVYAILSAERASTERDQFSVSNDAGRSWRTLGELPPEMRLNEWNEGPLFGRAAPSNVVVHPTNPAIIYVTGAGGTIARTTDGGATWKLLTTWEMFPASKATIR